MPLDCVARDRWRRILAVLSQAKGVVGTPKIHQRLKVQEKLESKTSSKHFRPSSNFRGKSKRNHTKSIRGTRPQRNQEIYSQKIRPPDLHTFSGFLTLQTRSGVKDGFFGNAASSRSCNRDIIFRINVLPVSFFQKLLGMLGMTSGPAQLVLLVVFFTVNCFVLFFSYFVSYLSCCLSWICFSSSDFPSAFGLLGVLEV